MAAGQSGAVLRDIETLFGTGTASGISDRQLLERFAHGRDASAEAAFEVLVRRHGPMVLRVCRNVLRNSNDAEDAFQATFLVLARRCGSIRRRDSVGELALRRGLPGGGPAPGRGGAAAGGRATAGRRRIVAACRSRGRRGRSVGVRPDRAGGSPAAAREIPRRGRALLLGGPDAGASRGAARAARWARSAAGWPGPATCCGGG